MKAIGECTDLKNNIYRETNTNTSFPYQNQTTGGVADIDGDGDGKSVAAAGGVGHTGAGFIMTIPVWSSFALATITALTSIML